VADPGGIVGGAVIDHNIIVLGIMLYDVVYHPLYVFGLVIGRYDQQQFVAHC
jgi:hypothetical protein